MTNDIILNYFRSSNNVMPTVQEEMQDKANIVSYARGIYRAAKTVVQKANKEGYDGIINPSRGANPITLGVYYIVKYMAKWDDDARSLAERMYFGINRKDNYNFSIVPVPLTADINMDNDDLKRLNRLNLTPDQVIDKMRYWGADFITALSYNKEKRVKDKNFQLIAWLFSEIERRHYVREFYENLPPLKKPILIDTAISGRASSTILQGLQKNELDVYSIIIGDGFVEGKEATGRLKDKYRRYFESLIHSDKLELVKMRRIITEDQGAALLGVYAAFYPQILLAALEMGLDNASAVTWYDVSRDGKRPSDLSYKETYQSFIQLVTGVAKMICSIEHQLGKEFEQLSDKDVLSLLSVDQINEMDKMIEDVVGKLKMYNMPRRENKNVIKRDFRLPISDAFETSSHVVHIKLQRNYLENKLRQLKEILGV